MSAFFGPELLVDVVFDREAVAVPTGYVGAVEPEHRARFDHDVLEDLVEGGADVDRTVRVRGTVVENEPRRALAGLPDLRVEIRSPASGPAFPAPAAAAWRASRSRSWEGSVFFDTSGLRLRLASLRGAVAGVKGTTRSGNRGGLRQVRAATGPGARPPRQ